MIPLEEWKEYVLSGIEPLPPMEVPLLEAAGLRLAEEVRTPHPLPPFDSASMDGYAVLWEDLLAGGGEAQLRVVGEVRAGQAWQGRLFRGEAVRISTGAALPPGADTVIPKEHAEETEGRVRVRGREKGAFVRGAGEDLREGEVVASPGDQLTPALLGLLASVGRASVKVRPRPRVGVFATGDELVEPPAGLGPGRIYDSNSYLLAALVREVGGKAFRGGVVPDSPGALESVLSAWRGQADVVLVTGGVSAGDHDYSRDLVSKLGGRVERVAIQPGMPQGFARFEGIPVFALPGNPVSVFVSYELFVRPALLKMMGFPRWERPRVRAMMEEPVASPPEKVQFLRVSLKRKALGWAARPTGGAGSHLLRTVALADGLAVIPRGVSQVPAGASVEVVVTREEVLLSGGL